MIEKIKQYVPLNFDLMGNPVNWVIITLMVLFAGVALATIMRQSPLTEKDTTT